jgi:hypothetical protein
VELVTGRDLVFKSDNKPNNRETLENTRKRFATPGVLPSSYPSIPAQPPPWAKSWKKAGEMALCGATAKAEQEDERDLQDFAAAGG